MTNAPTKFLYPAAIIAGISGCWSQLLNGSAPRNAGWTARNPRGPYGLTRLEKGGTVVDVLFAPGRAMHTTDAFVTTSAVGDRRVKGEIETILAEVRKDAELEWGSMNVERDPRPQILENDAREARAGAKRWDQWGDLEQSQLG